MAGNNGNGRHAAHLAPHSVEVEEALLGAILISEEALDRVAGILTVDDFFEVRHQWIYETCLQLRNHHEAIDNLTVVHLLRQNEKLDEVGGAAYITYLINNCPTWTNADTYARFIRAQGWRRKGMEMAGRLAALFKGDGSDYHETAEKVHEVYRQYMSRLKWQEMVSGRDVMDRVWQRYEQYTAAPQRTRGYTTRLDELDFKLGGWRPGLYGILGATGMGKSTLTSGLVCDFARQGKGVFAPTEVTADVAFDKMTCDLAGIPYKSFLTGFLTETQHELFQEAYGKVMEVIDNITVFDTPRPTLAALESEVRNGGHDWLIVDSGSVMARASSDSDESMRAAVSLVSQGLQQIARGGVITVATWQIGRAVKMRDDKRPTLNDAKESGSVEEDADVILGLYRHAYYEKRDQLPPDPKFPPSTARIYILKDRAGGEGDEFSTVKFVPGQGLRPFEQ